MTTILLIQLFPEPPLGISTLEATLSNQIGSQLVALDNFSDGSNLAYVRKMIEESEFITAIIWEHEGGQTKGLQPIFNALLKKKQQVTLITNATQGVVNKLARSMKSEMLMSEGDLIGLLNKSAKK